jgi:hypothetical protein
LNRVNIPGNNVTPILIASADELLALFMQDITRRTHNEMRESFAMGKLREGWHEADLVLHCNSRALININLNE